jgi:hypothetical protein
MTEKEKRKAANKQARVEPRKAERLEKARQKELAKKQEKDVREKNLRHAKIVRQKGLKGALEDEGISPSASSKPLGSQGVIMIGSQSLYSIKTKIDDNDFPDVLLLNDNADSILTRFDSVTEGDKPATWAAITSFVSKHQGNNHRQRKQCRCGSCRFGYFLCPGRFASARFQWRKRCSTLEHFGTCKGQR